MTQINAEEIIEILLSEKSSVDSIATLFDERIENCINKIKKDVQVLDDIIRSISKEKSKTIENLNKIKQKLGDKALEIIEDNIDNVELLIIDNLPKGIKGTKIELKDSCDGNSVAEIELTKARKVGKKIEVDYVGNISITKDDMMKIKVYLDNDKLSSEAKEFELSNIHRIYKVISYINDNLSYDE